MEYESFITEVKECVAQLCPNNDVRLEKIMKNNSCELDGLVIRRKGVDVAPTIYLNSYYSDYLNGRTIENIAAEIVEIDCRSRLDISIDIEEYRNFKIMKNRIMYKLISFEKNTTLLEKIPYRKYLDFAIVYYCIAMESDGSCATWVITNDFLNIWNVDEDVLFETASENTDSYMPVEIKSMPEILKELMPDTYTCELSDYYEDNIDGRPMMYVATNRQKLFGAGVILYPDVLINFARQYGSFYMLPSSIHEVIFVPDDGTINYEELKNMVQEVNSTQVQVHEFLSNMIYFYDSHTKELYILNK